MQNNVVTNTRRTAPHTDVIHWSTCKCTRSIYHSSGQHRDISAIHLSAHWHQKDPVPPLRPEIYDERVCTCLNEYINSTCRPRSLKGITLMGLLTPQLLLTALPPSCPSSLTPSLPPSLPPSIPQSITLL